MNMPFHTRRLNLPEGKGWIEIRGEFNPFDLDGPQRELIEKMSDWFHDFERTFPAQPSREASAPPEAAST